VWSFIGVNIAIFLSVIIGRQFASESIDHFWARVTAKDGIIAASIPIVAIVLTGVLSDTVKARLVFWRWNYPLPGCRVFTELAKKDPRIDVALLERKHGELPQKPQTQNMLWYKIYRQHKTLPSVWEAHKAYLLVRDLAILSAIFAVLFPVGVAFLFPGRKPALIYAGVLILQYLLTARAARNYGNRFVLNVLSEDSQVT
jgi:hypothetical protein